MCEACSTAGKGETGLKGILMKEGQAVPAAEVCSRKKRAGSSWLGGVFSYREGRQFRPRGCILIKEGQAVPDLGQRGRRKAKAGWVRDTVADR
jgi:hypothetical protein